MMVRRVRADLGIPDPKEAALKARKAQKARDDAKKAQEEADKSREEEAQKASDEGTVAAAASAPSGDGDSATPVAEATTPPVEESAAPAVAAPAPVVEAAAAVEDEEEKGPPSCVAGDVFVSCVREVCVMLLKDKVPSYVQARSITESMFQICCSL